MSETSSKSSFRTGSGGLLPVIALLLIGWLVYTFQVLIGPLIIAALLAYLMNPVVVRISAWTGLYRRKVVPLGYLVSILTMILAGIYLAPVFGSQANLLTRVLTDIPGQADSLVAGLEEAVGVTIPLEAVIEEFEGDLAQALSPNRVFRLFLNASTNIIWVVLILITSYHFLQDWPRLREWLFAFAPSEMEPELRRLHGEIKGVWQAYLRGQLLIMSILAILSGAALALLGVRGWLFLGLRAGGLALIPNLGPATATIVTALVAWVQGSIYLDISNAGLALIVVIVFQLIQLFEGIYLTPRIIGRRLNLHPGLVMVALVGTLFTLGALTALIVIPLIGSLDLVLRYVRRRHAGLDPWPEMEVEPPSELEAPAPEG